MTSLTAANLSPGLREPSALNGRIVQDHGDRSQLPESHPSGGAPAIQVAVTLRGLCREELQLSWFGRISSEVLDLHHPR